MRVLDLGSGPRRIGPHPAGVPQSQVTTFDAFAPDADIKWDMHVLPWPIDSGAFDIVWASHVMEHVLPMTRWVTKRDIFFDIMGEIHRVLRPNGLLIATTPFAGSVPDYCHISHYRRFVPETWERFARGHESDYGGGSWTLERWDVTKWEPRFPYSWPLGSYRRSLLTHAYARYPSLKRWGPFGRPAELRVWLRRASDGPQAEPVASVPAGERRGKI